MELDESIPECVDASVKFVKSHSSVMSMFPVDSIRRADIPEYDVFAIRELIVNAFCHRDWSISGQKIRLSIFDDRLEVFSPGSLPNTLRLENALSGVSYYRNPNIAQLCKDYELAEKAGRGLQKISKTLKENKKPDPEFINDPTFFQVILHKKTHETT